MEFNIKSSPQTHMDNSLTQMMMRVLFALVPALIAYVWFFGWGVVINILLAIVTALSCEALMLKLRQRPIKLFLSDGSAIVTATLLAIALPPLAPWWITVLGVAFAIIIAKHLYGGLGFNPFNPAMVGYVMLLISFPLEMTGWSAPLTLVDYNLAFMDSFSLIFTGQMASGLQLDALTMATPLDMLKSELRLEHTVAESLSSHPVFGLMGGVGWEWINLAILAGGAWLIYKKVISWHVPAGLLGSLFVISAVFYGFDSEHYASPLFHIMSGAAIFAAFFIATDPVTAPTTPLGRVIFGAGIGILAYVIRTWGGYPEGIAFAVLLMNMVAPTIDHYYQPRVFGHRKK